MGGGKIMKFEDHWNSVSYLGDKINGEIIHDMSAASWDMCKKEVLKIIANNTPTPVCGSMGEYKLHSAITNIVKEIEEL
jgi:hypothetical protein